MNALARTFDCSNTIANRRTCRCWDTFGLTVPSIHFGVRNHLLVWTLALLAITWWLTAGTPAEGSPVGSAPGPIPPAWEVLPIPRHADYGSPVDFLTLGRVAVVRRENGPYHTRRDARGELTRRQHDHRGGFVAGPERSGDQRGGMCRRRPDQLRSIRHADSARRSTPQCGDGPDVQGDEADLQALGRPPHARG